MAQKAKKVRWSDLDQEQKKEQIRTLWREGLSDKVIGDRLSATKGQIVGFRHTHLPKLSGENRTAYDDPAVDKVSLSGTEGMVITPMVISHRPEEHLVFETEPEAPEVIEPEPLEIPVAQVTEPCQWPLAKSRGIHQVDTCGKDSLPGLRCCAEHAPLVYRSRFKT